MNKKPMKKIKIKTKAKSKQKINSNTSKPTRKRGKRGFAIFVFILLVGSLSYSAYYLLTEPKFNISTIQVEGVTRYAKEDILKSSNIKTGANIFKVLEFKVEKSLEKYAYINEIKVVRKLPSTLTIKVTERKIKYLAYNKDLDKYIRLDEDGVILEIINKATIEKSEMLTFGITFSAKPKLKETLVVSEIAKLEFYEEVAEKYAGAKIDKKITSIKFEDGNIIIVLDYNLSVILDNQDLDYDIGNLSAILDNLEGKSGVLDMTKPSPIYTDSI